MSDNLQDDEPDDESKDSSEVNSPFKFVDEPIASIADQMREASAFNHKKRRNKAMKVWLIFAVICFMVIKVLLKVAGRELKQEQLIQRETPEEAQRRWIQKQSDEREELLNELSRRDSRLRESEGENLQREMPANEASEK